MEGRVRLKRGVESHVRGAESNVGVVVEGSGERRGEGFPGRPTETRGEEVRCYWSTVTRLV